MREVKVRLPEWAFEYFSDGFEVAGKEDAKFFMRKRIETLEDYVSWVICDLIKSDFKKK